MKFSEVLSWSGFKTWVSGPDHHAVAREARERAGSALPAGERLEDSHVVVIGEGVPAPPSRLRPDVFPGARSTTDRWLSHADNAERVLDRLNPVNAAVDAFDDRGSGKGQAMSGDWGSVAGQMACSLQPREGSGVVSVLVLGDHGLHVVHVQKSPDGRKTGPAVQYGWGVPRGRISWCRNRKDVKHGTHEIGFDDGSWVRILFPVSGWGTLAEALANSPGGSGPVS
ncbi:hypothetical protein [Streptomyces himalayensis]|uniref:Uncharacterized protein n=1 Tax=Streptomyces himalayensis subsp. himalayensis TaxID=2756131 RepID=A0A7W0I754_9ACTN|nr:hypothetical protein [Streptomyces himalayensis]MBA2944915.1 hypothetical protein [Streptomyces himalayensis subsp. himalayensis]